MTMWPKSPGCMKTLVPPAKGVVAVYAGHRSAQALHELTAYLDIYKGVRLGQLLETIDQQGKKDGVERCETLSRR